MVVNDYNSVIYWSFQVHYLCSAMPKLGIDHVLWGF